MKDKEELMEEPVRVMVYMKPEPVTETTKLGKPIEMGSPLLETQITSTLGVK